MWVFTLFRTRESRVISHPRTSRSFLSPWWEWFDWELCLDDGQLRQIQTNCKGSQRTQRYELFWYVLRSHDPGKHNCWNRSRIWRFREPWAKKFALSVFTVSYGILAFAHLPEWQHLASSFVDCHLHTLRMTFVSISRSDMLSLTRSFSHNVVLGMSDSKLLRTPWVP